MWLIFDVRVLSSWEQRSKVLLAKLVGFFLDLIPPPSNGWALGTVKVFALRPTQSELGGWVEVVVDRGSCGCGGSGVSSMWLALLV